MEIIRPLSAALRRRLEPVDRAAHPLDSLVFGSLHFGGELSRRDMSSTPEVKGRLFFAHADDVVYSKIDARNGAIGIVPETMPRVAFSSEYPIYAVDAAVALPEYVKLLFRMSSFRERINSLISGASGRKRVEPGTLESIEVPLPPLATQRAIVAHWRTAQESLAATAQANDAHEAAVRRDFLAALGLSDRAPVINRRAFALRWTEFERWGVEQARKVSGSLDPAEGKFPVVRLREVIANLQNGWSPKCFDRPAATDEWGVLKLGAVSFGTFNENENKALPPSFIPLPAHEVKPDDVLFIRGNVLRLVGACSHVAATRPRLMMPDLVFRAVFRKESEIDRRYLAEVMRTPHLRQQIEAVATGTSPTMKKISKPGLLALRLPLPPLAIQRQLVAAVTAARARIAAARAAAAQLAAATAREVEEMILGVRAVPVAARPAP